MASAGRTVTVDRIAGNGSLDARPATARRPYSQLLATRHWPVRCFGANVLRGPGVEGANADGWSREKPRVRPSRSAQ